MKAAGRGEARRPRSLPLAVSLVALGLVVVSPTGASAQALKDNGKIAFASNRDGDPEIYTMNPDGSGVERLTFNTPPPDSPFPLLDFWPNWSPDGTKIVYTSFRITSPGSPPNGDVFIMDADGANKTRITDDPAGDLDPAFFPDGRKIVFVREVPSPDPFGPPAAQDIWTMDIDGTDARNLTPGPELETEPAVSPDGTKIAFERGVGDAAGHETGNHEIFVMNADGSNVTRLTETGYRREQHPSFSPDGTRIVFDDNFHGPPGATGFIYSMNVDGSDVTQLTSRTDRHGLPSYSPDGTKLTFTASEDIWVMDADGSNQVRLTDNNPAFDIQSNWQPIPRAAAQPQPLAPAPTPPPPPAPDACATEGAPGYLYPAKMRVRRAEVDREDRVLDVYAPITSRADGDVDVTFQANQRTDTFDAEVTEGDAVLDRIRFREPITRGQARLGTGIVTLDYKGDADTRPEEVRLRAAPRRAELDVERISLSQNGRLSARGSVTSRAQGIVRFRYSYIDAAGNPQVWPARAEIQDDGDWRLNNEAVPPQLARCGGYLSILFTGFFEQRIRGEMLAYQLNPGQTRTPTTVQP